MTKLHVVSSNSADTTPDATKNDSVVEETSDPPLPPYPSNSASESSTDDTQRKAREQRSENTQKQDVNSYTWRIWWSRPDGYAGDEGRQDKSSKEAEIVKKAQKTPLPYPTPSEDKIMSASTNTSIIQKDGKGPNNDSSLKEGKRSSLDEKKCK